MRSRRPRDDDEVEVAVGVLVELRDRDSSKDRVWRMELQLGFTAWHGATTELPEVEPMHGRRHGIDDVTDNNNDVTLNDRPVTMTSPCVVSISASDCLERLIIERDVKLFSLTPSPDNNDDVTFKGQPVSMTSPKAWMRRRRATKANVGDVPRTSVAVASAATAGSRCMTS